MRRLRLWREGDQPAPAHHYRVHPEEANVRQGPGIGYPIVIEVKPGEIVVASCVVRGECIKGDDRWLHRADGLGFMHMSVVEPVEAVLGGAEDADGGVLGGAAEGEAPPLRFVALFEGLAVRAEPSLESATVATLCQGSVVYARGLVIGQPLGDSPYWAALAEPRGFVHQHLLRQIECV
jgi:hypothetical protein